MKKFAPTLVALTMSTTAAFAQDSAGVPPVLEPGEIFDVCAAHALDNTPEAQPKGNMSALSIGENFADQNGTRLELNGFGGITVSGPGAETALREFYKCFNDPNLTL